VKTTAIRNPLLALTAVGALLAFILACSSFSPDDSKVLYPTVDPGSGGVGVAIYDRESRRSQIRFVPIGLSIEHQEAQPILVRAQWMANGQEILVAWPWVDNGAAAAEDGLNLAVLPASGNGATRLFHVPDLSESLTRILFPLPVAGSGLFLAGQEPGSVIRMDLRTGAMAQLEGMDEMFLLPTAHADRLLYLGQDDDSDEMEVGWMQADTGVRTVLFETDPLDLGPDEGFFAVSHDGQRLVHLDDSGPEPVCRFLERERPSRTLSLGLGAEDLTFGNALFSPEGSVIYVSILAPAPEQDRLPGGLGFLEVPVDGGAVRRTILAQDSGDEDFETAAYFQIGLSGDGRTLAVSSAFYAFDEQGLKPEDCALFLVDLADPNRAVTKVSVPLPIMRE